jgi:hypothetical protein
VKVIIAGPRDYEDYSSLVVAIRLSEFDITEVVSGHARGVDGMGERWSREVLGKEPKLFPADWGRYGNGAGPRRNLEMVGYADAAIIIWDGMSRGTGSMLKIAKVSGLRWFVYGIRGYRPIKDSRWLLSCQ